MYKLKHNDNNVLVDQFYPYQETVKSLRFEMDFFVYKIFNDLQNFLNIKVVTKHERLLEYSCFTSLGPG